ncbi:MAG: hypothetical protein J1E96_04175 [Ruminococcus sp.]|nr:hypothetical protein [Ruminococcus sp.]
MKKYLKKFSGYIITVIVVFLVIFIFKSIKTLNDDLFNLHLYIGWQEVKIDDYATIKVPGNWKQGEENGLIYFYDSDLPDGDNVVLFQTNMLYDMFDIGSPIKIDEGSTEQNIASDNFQRVVTLTGTGNSLGSSNGKALVCVNNNSKIEDYIHFTNGRYDFEFFSNENRVDEKTIKKIADSVDFLYE